MLSLLLAIAIQTPPVDTSRVHITVSPEPVHIERRDGQALNFDFVIRNARTDSLQLDAVEVTVLDQNGKFVMRRFLDGNGFSPSILTIPQRVWAPGATHLVFNPFHTFQPQHDISELIYEFRFSVAGASSGAETVISRTVALQPRVYRNRTALTLPLDGLLLVYDGHDFYSHHRRLDYTHPVAQQVGITRNFGRYAYDFVRIDSAGLMSRPGAAGNGAWYGFGDDVLAPAAGTVVASFDTQPDNVADTSYFDPSKLVADPMSLYGNYIVIDHGSGEFSVLGHLRRGSVRVKTGARVEQGDALAQVGSSGSSFFPHLHYELRTGATLDVEGLPSYFSSFDRIYGSRVIDGGTDAIDTGDVIRSRRAGSR